MEMQRETAAPSREIYQVERRFVGTETKRAVLRELILKEYRALCAEERGR